MIMVAPGVEPDGQVLTPEEYDALPEDPRREFVDGVVRVMATPSMRHQIVKDGLVIALRPNRPADIVVVSEQEIRIGPLFRRIPDVVVLRRAAVRPDRSQYEPADIVLAIEVVSPGSESTDRILKPIEYAGAGIEHFWRVEIDPAIRVHTFVLRNGGYEMTGAFKERETVSVPGLEWARVNVAGLADGD